MHPFGGTPICPRCDKAVYAAEQVMGPGRKLYHKPCLACMSCSKRLDSYSLVEHNQEPYCKPCHTKNFGTRDLRSANLPHREESLGLARHHTGMSASSPPAPTFVSSTPPDRTYLSRSPPPRIGTGYGNGNGHGNGNGNGRHGTKSPSPTLRPTRTLSPDYEHITVTARPGTTSAHTPPRARSVPPRDLTPPPVISYLEERTHGDAPPFDDEDSEERDTFPTDHDADHLPTHSMRAGDSDFPRTSTLTHSYTRSPPHSPTSALHHPPSSPTAGSSSSYYNYGSAQPPQGHSQSAHASPSRAPLVQTATGTRYGAGLMMPQATGGAGRTFGSVNPKCPKCGKNVYFAEQIKAVGKTWHKTCLRCSECKTTLDSSKLTDKDGEPYCRNCYGKLHGPAGRGYALLGKAGG